VDPVSFEESNTVLGPPNGVTEDDCGSLFAFRGKMDATQTPVVITCWKPTREELNEIERTGRVWLMVWGQIMQPVVLTAFKPFQTPGSPSPQSYTGSS
jgi:hypothetical protein